MRPTKLVKVAIQYLLDNRSNLNNYCVIVKNKPIYYTNQFCYARMNEKRYELEDAQYFINVGQTEDYTPTEYKFMDWIVKRSPWSKAVLYVNGTADKGVVFDTSYPANFILSACSALREADEEKAKVQAWGQMIDRLGVSEEIAYAASYQIGLGTGNNFCTGIRNYNINHHAFYWQQGINNSTVKNWLSGKYISPTAAFRENNSYKHQIQCLFGNNGKILFGTNGEQQERRDRWGGRYTISVYKNDEELKTELLQFHEKVINV